MQTIITAATPHLLEILGLILTAIIGWAASKARQKWGLDIEAKHRDALHEALMTAARLAIGRNLTGQAAISLILDYAKRSVPDALDKLSPPAVVIENLAQSKLEKAAVEAGKAIGKAIKAGR
ncbi:hypothetical protein [Paracoccus sp. 22332]|uniref:hypothetical protein n=1 Tax=Paracoccus sp. 22332 TaxID=3453913 RepID=UPI003F840CFF